MENNDQLAIVERYEKTYLNNRLTYQYIEHLTDPKNRYLYEPHVGFFNVMFWIYSDHLILSLMKLFDPAIMGQNENFSIEMIEKQLDISLINKEEPSVKNAIKVLKEYRNKYLAHLDYQRDRIYFPSTHELLKEAKILLEVCHKICEKLNDTEMDKKIILKDNHQIMSPLLNSLFLTELLEETKKGKQLRETLQTRLGEWKREKNSN